MASWRRRTMTVRTSCRVAAKRIWPTSDERRSAASSDMSPTRVRPTAATASETTMASEPVQTRVSGATPRLPQAAAGLWATTPTPSANAQAMRTTPSVVASGDGTRNAEVHSATP